MNQNIERYPRLSLRKRIMLGVAAWSVLIGQFAPVLALPTGADVRNGTVTFEETDGYLRVLQESGGAIVHYDSFNIGSAETVEFVQPGSAAAILNRVVGGSPSDILGSMLANGRVYLINPNGIVFGTSARVNVGGLVASSFNISDSDFASGNLKFTGPGGAVINKGSISAGGFAYLIGGSVDNSGSISAGSVVLAAGQSSIVLDRAGGGEIRLVIDEVDSQVGADCETTGTGGSGTEGASDGPSTGGAPQPPADATADLADSSAVVGAAAPLDGSPVSGGGAGDPLPDVTVVNSGVIDVSGDSGGEIAMQGRNVGQFGTLNADGVLANGGRISMQAAETVVIGSESVTTANAGLAGQGGMIEIVGENYARIGTGARIEARGGSESGDGGYVETSGKRGFAIGSAPDVGADHGSAGTWLIDPYNIEITAVDDGVDTSVDPWAPDGTHAGLAAQISVATILLGLDTANVHITTTPTPDAGADAGDITVLAALDYSGKANDLTLEAANNILFTADVTGGPNSLNLIAGGSVSQAGGTSVSGGTLDVSVTGNVSLDQAGNDFDSVMGSAGGNVTLVDVDDLDLAGVNIGSGAGSLTLTVGGNLSDASGNAAGAVSIIAGNAVTLDNLNDFNSVAGTAASMTVNDVDGLWLGTVTTSGDLTINAGGPLVDAAGEERSVSGNANFNAGAGVITVGPAGAFNAGSLTFNTTAGAVAIQEDSATELVGISTADSLTLTSAGAVTDNGASVTVDNGAANITGTSITLADAAGEVLSVSGNANFNVGAGAITVGPAGAFNAGTLTFNTTAGAVAIQEDDATDLAGTSTADSLALTSAGAIIQTAGSLSVVGATTLNASGDITLANAANDFQAAVNADGVNIDLVDANGIELGEVAATGTLDVEALEIGRAHV